MTEMTVEVLAVSNVTEIKTGNLIAAVAFGENVTVNDEVRARISSNANAAPFMNAQKIPATTLQLFFPFRGVLPYKIGSKWKLIINDDNGEISLEGA